MYFLFNHKLPSGHEIIATFQKKKKRERKSIFGMFSGTAQYRYNGNQTHQGPYEVESAITSTYDDGHWSKPYFDCGGAWIWMLTYTVPFFGYKNGTFKFK